MYVILLRVFGIEPRTYGIYQSLAMARQRAEDLTRGRGIGKWLTEDWWEGKDAVLRINCHDLIPEEESIPEEG